MIKGVVFDLDHTLFDRYATLTEIAPIFYEKLKDRIMPGLGVEDVALSLIYADKKYISYGLGRVAEYLNDSGFFHIPISADEYKEVVFDCFEQAAIPYPFTQVVLGGLRDLGYKLGLITNGSSRLQNAKLRMLGLSGAFDEIVISGEVGVTKPDTAIFGIMVQRLGIPASELLYVGDNPINDVDASRRAGYTPVWVRTYEWQCPEIKKCELQIDTIADIFDLLKGLQ